MNFFQKIKKYLPSKKFSLIISSFIILIFIVGIILSFSNKNQKFTALQNNTGLESIENKTIEEIINTDTDLDSIYDWEEVLWGTDKTKISTFGIPDKDYIENKKRELNIEQEIDDKRLTETEQFARNFFTSYTALKSSGQVDDQAINEFSKTLGEKVVNTEITDSYTLSDVKTSVASDKNTIKVYYEKLESYYNKYQDEGIGDELEILNSGVIAYTSTGKETNYEELSSIAKAYQNFATSVINTVAPESVKEIHLKIANAAKKTGESILNMKKSIKDPIVGLSGITQYQKYSAELVGAVEELETLLP